VSNKNKNSKNFAAKAHKVAGQAGLLLMTMAATVGMIELPDHQASKIVVPNQPAFAFVNENAESNNPIRSEREESAPHYISYSEVQRTPSRSGRH